MQTDFISEMTEGCEINARQVKGMQTLVERSRCLKHIVRKRPLASRLSKEKKENVFYFEQIFQKNDVVNV